MKIEPKLLAAQPFLKGLTQSQLEVLANNALLVEFAAGKLIFEEGLAANRFYILLSGEVVLEAAGQKERDPLQTIKAGDVLGWSWLFPPYQWNFNARAVQPTQAIIFFASTLREASEKDPALGYELMKRVSHVVINRLQATRHKLLQRERA